MAIHFSTSNPKGLYARFQAAVGQAEPKGRIDTWAADASGQFYSHTSAQWRERAWLKASFQPNTLTFNIHRPADWNVKSSVYAFYHGHMIETFLNHFDNAFTIAAATALPVAGDNCNE